MYDKNITLKKGLMTFMLALIPLLANFLLDILPVDVKTYTILGIITVEAVLTGLKNYFKNRDK